MIEGGGAIPKCGLPLPTKKFFLNSIIILYCFLFKYGIIKNCEKDPVPFYMTINHHRKNNGVAICNLITFYSFFILGDMYEEVECYTRAAS